MGKSGIHREPIQAGDGTTSTTSRAPAAGDSLFELALQTGQLGSWEHDLDCGKFTCRGIFERVYGLRPDQGLDYDDFVARIHSQDRQGVLAAIQRGIEEGCGFEVEHRMVSPDGRVHWIIQRGRPSSDEEGRARRVVAVAFDVTAQRKAEQDRQATEHLFTMFMGNLKAAAWMKDLRGRYVFANDEAVRTFGTSREELYGKTDDEVFPPDIARHFTDNDRLAISRQTTLQTTETLIQADGPHQSIVNKFLILGTDEQPMFVGGIAIDITDRVRAEEELRENDRRKDEFLAMLGHELRNPLAAVKNAVELAKMPHLDPLDRAWTYEIMDRQMGQLARLIDDLLDVSRITRGKIQLKREVIDLGALVDRAIQAVRPRIEELKHALTVGGTADGGPWVVGDPARLEQVFVNLLTNAAKYTRPGGRIDVVCERVNHQAVARVKDSGVGIAAEMLPRVFDLFAQADRSIDRAQGGLGIGLTLARKLVELHGGQISASSDGEGRGSEFTVRLPVADPPVSTRHEADARRPRGSRRNLLVVDDNHDAAAALAKLLTVVGHEVRVAHSGTEALAMITDLCPQVVLLDIGLPGMDGHSVARAVRAAPAAKGVLLIAISGYGRPEDRQRSHEAGFDHHLVKPVIHEELLRLIDEGVKQAGLPRAGAE